MAVSIRCYWIGKTLSVFSLVLSFTCFLLDSICKLNFCSTTKDFGKNTTKLIVEQLSHMLSIFYYCLLARINLKVCLWFPHITIDSKPKRSYCIRFLSPERLFTNLETLFS